MMVASASRGFVFAHVPRTGGTSVEVALRPFGEPAIAVNPGTGHETLSDFLARTPALGGAFKFAFVRNPWDRAVSFYFHARQRLFPTLPQMQSVASFEDMLRLMDRGAGWIADLLSLRPQIGFLRGPEGSLLIDFVGRFERLEQDFAAICRRLGMTASLPRQNESRRGAYAGYYSDWGKGFVAARYREDIQTFGYSFEVST